MSTLALYGGTPVRSRPLPPRPPYGMAERNVANEVVASGQLSGFLADEEGFLGGPRVQSLERAFCEFSGSRYAVAMNSATSCLFGAVRAIVEPRDEVIVPPWSMSASVACVLEAGATPVFADVESETYGLTAGRVEERLSRRTKAILMVDLFGCVPRDVEKLTSYDVPVIEDAAQAIGARGDSLLAGTIGDVGVYSLNRHKVIQCGEGGVAVTNDEEVAGFLRGYRNHGEVLDYRKGYRGGNYRLGEVEAAIAEVQLGRLGELTEPRVQNADRITAALSEMPGVIPPSVPEGFRHVYYLYAFRVSEVSAEVFALALSAEGIPASTYVPPLYRVPAFRGYAVRDDSLRFEAWYPEVERAYREVLVLPHVHAGMTEEDVGAVISAIDKVWDHRGEL